MSALALIREAITHGVSISLDGDKLALTAQVKPPDELLARIKASKPEIVKLLRREPELLSILTGQPPNVIDLAAERHRRRTAANEARLAGIWLGPDGATPLDEYRRLEKQGQEAWKATNPTLVSTLPEPELASPA